MKRRWSIGLVTLALLWPCLASAQTLVLLVRHAERADGGAPAKSMTGAPADPTLSPAGEAHAAQLASMLADAGIKAIYTTEFRRTKDTAAPLAAKIGVGVTSMASSDTAALVAAIKRDHPRDVVLVVGHSNTIPAVIKALGGPSVTLADADYGSLFVLAPATGALTRLRYR